MKSEFSQQILGKKCSSIKVNENPMETELFHLTDVRTDGQTWRSYSSPFPTLRTHPFNVNLQSSQTDDISLLDNLAKRLIGKLMWRRTVK